MLNDVMKALTIRKPIALTTTSMCSGTFAARIARSQRQHVLRVAGVATAGWENVGQAVNAGLFKAYGVDVQTTILPDAAAAVDALTGGVADVAWTDTLTAVRAGARNIPVQFVAITAGLDAGYVALASAIDANAYAMARFARALRDNSYATYVDPRDLQARIDRFASEQLIDRSFPAQAQISRVAVMSGTR
jgi:ABC-type phosphate/phosphonate transport system substrate-binding protein